MNRRAAERPVRRRNGKTEKSSTSGPRGQKNNSLRFFVSKESLPQFLLEAKTAVETGRIAEAAALIDDKAQETVTEIIEKNPSRTDIMFMLAMVLVKTGQMDRAEYWYKKILEQQPHALVYSELALICQSAGRLSEAREYLKSALELVPDNAELCNNLAMCLIQAGQTQESIDLLQKAVEEGPANAAIHSTFLLYLHYLPNLDPHILFTEHIRWSDSHVRPDRAKVSHNNPPEPGRKLRIGYISADFCMHSVARFFEPLLDGRDRRSVEVYGYGNVTFPDQITERLKHKFDHYRNICGMSDEAVVGMIEEDAIDILVDLAGHTAGNRVLVLARKPAPIQVTYLGYPNTTGVQAVDYRLTDNLADTAGAQEFYTEELVSLPAGFLCYRPPEFAPPVASLAAERNGYVTFGSFNNSCKINPTIVALWSCILKANDKSHFLLKFKGGDDRHVRDHYLNLFEQWGIEPERVEIYGLKSPIEHLGLYAEVDIALDTYPYNGTTTTCEAMWMGVPVISLVGRCHASRVGLSILTRTGLEFFAVSTPDEYVAKATALASKPDSLAKIRASMRERIAASGFCDANEFAGGVEEAYRKMWHKWCKSRGADVLGENLAVKVRLSETDDTPVLL